MDGKITIGTELDTKSFDMQIAELERELEQLEKSYETGKMNGMQEDSQQMRHLGLQAEKTRNKLVGLYEQKEKLGQSSGTGLSAMNTGLKTAILSAGKLALAIFGIRTAYLAVRQASSYLASYDKQYAANLEYIKYALTQVIAPVLRWIVSLAAKVLQIINTIINALFGINLFANSSAKSFQKMKAGAGGTAKAAKEIKKQLAGFDEMNILQDNKDTGGGGGGAVAPSFDLSNLEEKLDFSQIGYKVDELLTTLDEKFVSGFTKIGENIETVLRALGFSDIFIEMFHIAFKGIQDIISGFIKVVRGFLDIIIGFVTGDIELVKRGFDAFIKGIVQMVTGFVELAMGIIGMLVTTVLSWIKAIWDWFYSTIIAPVGRFIADLLAKVGQALTNIWNAVKDKFTQIKTFVTNVINNIISLFKVVGTKVGNAIGGSFKSVVNTILGAVENILNKPIQAINGMIDKINSLPGVNVGWHLDEFHLPRLAKGGIVNMPNKGVMVGNAIAGESGKEGVIPLTDTQAMETLGEAIGRYITINANITNSMNGKVLSRELKRINNEQDFAYNS